MATAALVSNIENARRLQWELTRCTQKIDEVRESILARCEPDVVRRRFRECQTAMLSAGRLLMLDRRFKCRLPTAVRNEALDMLRNDAAPIAVQKKLGLTGVTVQNLRHRELGDHRNLLHARKLTEAQIAEIKAGNGTPRAIFAKKFGVSIDVVSRARCSRGSYREVKEISPVQTRKPGPAPTNELRLRFNSELMDSLTEMAELTSPKRPGIPEIQSYVVGLVEAQIADFRCRRIPADFLRNDKTPDDPEVGDIKPRGRFRGRFSIAERERINAQHDAGGLTPKEIARRWGCSATTIRRALDCD